MLQNLKATLKRDGLARPGGELLVFLADVRDRNAFNEVYKKHWKPGASRPAAPSAPAAVPRAQGLRSPARPWPGLVLPVAVACAVCSALAVGVGGGEDDIV